jgi:citrate/tricarballylate utilization protein
LALFLVLAVAMSGSLLHKPLAGDFYAVFPHNLLVSMFAPIFLFAVLALALGVRKFWQDVAPGAMSGTALTEATSNVLRLKYLGGGHGQGCNEADDAFTLWRRRFHHFTFYGFMLCFAATAAGTIYHYVFGIRAPYPFWSLPVVLGTLGGLGLIVGPVGLLWLRRVRDPDLGDPTQTGMDVAFIALLFITSVTGLALLALRETHGMGVALAIHLGAVLALFVTLPYGKFVHALYRFAALVRFHIERRRPLPETGTD